MPNATTIESVVALAAHDLFREGLFPAEGEGNLALRYRVGEEDKDREVILPAAFFAAYGELSHMVTILARANTTGAGNARDAVTLHLAAYCAMDPEFGVLNPGVGLSEVVDAVVAGVVKAVVTVARETLDMILEGEFPSE